MTDLTTSNALRKAFYGFVREGCGIDLSESQLLIAGSILESVYCGLGASFFLHEPAGDDHQDELQIQLLSYLLRMRNDKSGMILSIHPGPSQQVQVMDHLVERLWGNVFTRGRWHRQGDDFALGSCRARFRYMDDGLLPERIPPSLVFINQVQDINKEAYAAQYSYLVSAGEVTCVYSSRDLVSDKLMGNELPRRQFMPQPGNARMIVRHMSEEKLPSIPGSQPGNG